MTAALYDKGRQAFLEGDIDWTNDDIRIVLVDTALYTVDLALHDFLDDVAGPARIATMIASMTSKTSTDGVADADDVILPTVTGAESEAIIIFRDTGDPGTSQLIAYLTSPEVSGLPVTPTGGAITVQWDSGSLRIFRL